MSELAPGSERTLDAILRGALDCVHCGLCLPSCPTYRETGREPSSPRGRVHLMRAVAEGRVPLGEVVAEEMYLCLGCRACETACPSGVRYGELIEGMRAEVERAGLRTGAAKRIEHFALREIVARPARLRALVSALALVERLGLVALARRLAPASLRGLVEQTPSVPPRASRRPLPALVPAQGERRGRVALFVGCVMPELFGDVSHATARVLARNGFDVVVPRTQGCCGALHAHAGDADFARTLARRNLAAFELRDVDAIVVDSAGCGASLRDYRHWLPGDGAPLAAAVRDVCEWLDAVGLRAPERALRMRACYDDPCHLAHGQRVVEAPRRVLAAIPGLELVAHDDPASCCGAAGIYSLTHSAMSEAVLARKLDALAAASPDAVVTGNPGCLMQLRRGVARRGWSVRVVHPVTLLDEAYGGA